MKYFKVVARLGNLSKSAKELFVTEPNISRSMTRLEAELGVPLFERRKGQIVLNEYGRLFLSTVTLMLEDLDSGIIALQNLFDNRQNILKLACPIDDFLPDMLKRFSIINPQIGIRQFKMPQKEIESRLLEQAVDLAIFPKPPQQKRLKFTVLHESRYVLLVSTDHHFAQRTNISISELINEKFICDASRLDQFLLKEICIKKGFEPHIGYELENVDLIYNLLEGNNGVTFVPLPQFEKITKQGKADKIVAIDISDSDMPGAMIGISHHISYTFSDAARLFMNFVSAEFEPKS